jgi:uncharacterized protein (DUF305 family)
MKAAVMFLRFSSRRWFLLVAGLVLALVLSLIALYGPARAGSADAADPSAVDLGFSRDMQTHHTQAVEMAMIVREQTSDPVIDAVAYDMALAQQHQIGQMYTWLEQWNQPQSTADRHMQWMGHTPGQPEDQGSQDSAAAGDAGGGHGTSHGASDGTSPSASAEPGSGSGIAKQPVMPGLASAEDLQRLRTLTGVEAERLFLTLMIEHHQGGILMAKEAQDKAETPVVREFAEKQVIAQDADIATMQELLAERA